MTTSSTWIIACRPAKRWFDLDAVRTEFAAGENGGGSGVFEDGIDPRGRRHRTPERVMTNAGAPPLDWHSDLPDPAGTIRTADEWQPPARSALEQLDGLPRKIVLSMCPWAVCRVCGVARERVVGEAAYVRPDGSTFEHDGTGFNDHTTDALKGRSHTVTGADNGNMSRVAPTLGWSDCGHDNYRPGIVYDPAAGVLLHRTSEDDMTLRYIVGDTRDVTATIPDGSVDLIFTSPPFLALRSYLPAEHADKHREIGSEANPAAFLDVLLELTAGWGRVLAPHGTLAVELGDTYSGSGGDTSGDNAGNDRYSAPRNKPKRALSSWPLAKSLACIPQLYMIGLAYGINPLTGEQSPAGRWRVRNWIAWHRPNPPVGALGDKWRPASSYITVACKGAKRWFDLDAVRTETDRDDLGGLRKGTPRGTDERRTLNGETANMTGSNPAGAPPLDWHTDGDLGVGHIILSTQPYPGSHYATFPVDLPRKIIDCMCPRQVCRVCGMPRDRVVEATRRAPADDRQRKVKAAEYRLNGHDSPPEIGWEFDRQTLGWSDCGHDKWRPGIVYDPFAGSGTTLEAAQDLGRDGIGADLDERNSWLARERLGMFAEFDTLDPDVVDVVSDLL